MEAARSALAIALVAGLLVCGCSTVLGENNVTTLELAGTFNVPGGVSYSLKDDAVNCRTTTILVQDLKAKGDDLQHRKVPITANTPVVVEVLYDQVQPKGGCRVTVEFLPTNGGHYLISLNQVSLIFGPRCDVFLKEYVPHSKSFADKPFKKVCG